MNRNTGNSVNGKPNGKYHDDQDNLPTPNEYGKYDPADFIIPASDAKGHSERVWCRLQPGHDRQLDIILRSRKFPFHTKGDIIRWATVRGLRILEQMEDVPSVMKQVDMMMDVLSDEQLNQDNMVVFEKMRERVSAYIASNSNGQARRLVARQKMYAMDIPDEYWRGVYLERIEKEFGYLLESGGGAGSVRASRLGKRQKLNNTNMDDVPDGTESE